MNKIIIILLMFLTPVFLTYFYILLSVLINLLKDKIKK